jgi:hypothetical protein
MADYFQNEVWDTGGDGRITITGDIYSTADPFSIYVGAAPVKSIEFIDGGINVIGAIQVNGVPLTLTTIVEDLAPGEFGANETPGIFSFRDGLIIVSDIATVDTNILTASYNADAGPKFYNNTALSLASDTDGILIDSQLFVRGYATFVGNGIRFEREATSVGLDAYWYDTYSTSTFFAGASNLTLTLNDDAGTPANSLATLSTNANLNVAATRRLYLSGANIEIESQTGSIQLIPDNGVGTVNVVGSFTVNDLPFTSDGFINIVKSASQDVTNSTTLVNDTELFFSVLAGQTYMVSMSLTYSGTDATGDYKFDFALSAGTMSGRGFCSGFNSAQSLTSQDINLAGVADSPDIVIGTNGPESYAAVARIDFAFTCTANATLTFRFANSASGTGRISRTWKGTILRYKQIS